MYQVIDKNGTAVSQPMYRKRNAQEEADHFNAHGLPEFRPYTVGTIADTAWEQAANR